MTKPQDEINERTKAQEIALACRSKAKTFIDLADRIEGRVRQNETTDGVEISDAKEN